MKISKLFHWLYCAVMFLPLIMFLPNGLYYAFNEHATNSETITINYKYQSNEVNSLDDLVQGNIYYLDELVIEDFGNETGIEVCILKFDDFNSTFNDSYADDLNLDLYDSNNTYLFVSWITEDTDFYVNLHLTSQKFYVNYFLDDDDAHCTFTNCIFFVTENLDLFADYCLYKQYLPLYTNYNLIENVEVNTEDTITNKIYQGWEQVWDLPVFSWTHNTFFSGPFNYISSLFGFQAGNSISYLLSYWFSISIIWLVFDLMIYVPLLVHRWLDKASIS